MVFYVISRERLMYEYDYNIKRLNKGVMNWFVSVDGFLNILLDIDNVQYIYRQSAREADPVIRSMMAGSKSILGVMHGQELQPRMKEEEEIEIKPVNANPEEFPEEPDRSFILRRRKNPKVFERSFYETFR